MGKSYRRVKTKYVAKLLGELVRSADSADEIFEKLDIKSSTGWQILEERRPATSIKHLNRIAEYKNCVVRFLGDEPVLIPKSQDDLEDRVFTIKQLEAILSNEDDEFLKSFRTLMDVVRKRVESGEWQGKE